MRWATHEGSCPTSQSADRGRARRPCDVDEHALSLWVSRRHLPFLLDEDAVRRRDRESSGLRWWLSRERGLHEAGFDSLVAQIEIVLALQVVIDLCTQTERNADDREVCAESAIEVGHRPRKKED